MNKKIIRVALSILIPVATLIIGYYIGSGNGIPLEWQELIDTFMPTLLGIVTAVGVILLKQKGYDLQFTNMLAQGSEQFNLATANVTKVLTRANKTDSRIGEIADGLERANQRLDSVDTLKDTLISLNKKIDIIVQNDPNLVKSGIAAKVLGVGNSEEQD